MSAGTRLYDNRWSRELILGVIALTIAAWVLAVLKTYPIPQGKFVLIFWYGALATITDHRLWIPPTLAFLWGSVVFVLIVSYTRTGFGIADYSQKLRGNEIASAAQLRDRCKEYGKKQLRFMGIPVPIATEYQHYEVVGSTGSGKSQVIADYIESALSRGDRMITVDPNGTFMSEFFQEGDYILNPFDQRGQSWSIFNEIKTPYDVEQFSVSIIPKSPQTEQEQWNSMARKVVAETMLKLCRLKMGTTEKLVYWLTIASNEELGKMLSDTAAAGMFHGAEETLGSVRAVLTNYVTAHKYLEPPVPGEVPFSIRDWLDRGKGNLWVTWREDMLPAQKPLIACWVDVICASSLSSSIENAVDMHLVCDELDSLEKQNYLIQAATKGRKHKLHLFCGFQSYAQLDGTNGKDDAMTLRNSLRNSGSMGISDKDTYTAEQVQKAFGKHVVIRERLTTTRLGMPSISMDQVEEDLVLTSQIHTLPDLTGYLKFSGDYPVVRAKLKYKKRPKVTQALIVMQNRWTQAFNDQPAPGLFAATKH
jgi:type IV secretory pathway TraG/TraD family ATPase VirD4